MTLRGWRRNFKQLYILKRNARFTFIWSIILKILFCFSSLKLVNRSWFPSSEKTWLKIKLFMRNHGNFFSFLILQILKSVVMNRTFHFIHKMSLLHFRQRTPRFIPPPLGRYSTLKFLLLDFPHTVQFEVHNST